MKKSISVQFNGPMDYFKSCGLPLEHFELTQEDKTGVVIANVTKKIKGLKSSGYYAVIGIGENQIQKYEDGKPVEAKEKESKKKKSKKPKRPRILFEEAVEILKNLTADDSVIIEFQKRSV